MTGKLHYEQIRELIRQGKAIPEGARFRLPMNVHHWFELTYAQYLTVPRSILQSMPYEWQYKFVELLNELDSTFDWRPEESCYRVQLCQEVETEQHETAWGWGDAIEDPLMNYRHPNRAYIESLRRNRQVTVGDIRIDATWDFESCGFIWKAYRQWCQYDVLISDSGAMKYESPEDAIAAGNEWVQSNQVNNG